MNTSTNTTHNWNDNHRKTTAPSAAGTVGQRPPLGSPGPAGRAAGDDRAAVRMSSATAVKDVIRLDAVRKVYGEGSGAVTALAGVSLGFAPGSFSAVMGPSGSGKSTFLHVAAGLDAATDGEVYLGGTSLSGRNETELTVLRRERVGFVFQAFNLMPALTVAQNIVLPMRLAAAHRHRSCISSEAGATPGGVAFP